MQRRVGSLFLRSRSSDRLFLPPCFDALLSVSLFASCTRLCIPHLGCLLRLHGVGVALLDLRMRELLDRASGSGILGGLLNRQGTVTSRAEQSRAEQSRAERRDTHSRASRESTHDRERNPPRTRADATIPRGSQTNLRLLLGLLLGVGLLHSWGRHGERGGRERERRGGRKQRGRLRRAQGERDRRK